MKNLLIIFAIIIGICVPLFIGYSILYGLSYRRLMNILAQDSFIFPIECVTENYPKYGIPIVWVVSIKNPNNRDLIIDKMPCHPSVREINVWTGKSVRIDAKNISHGVNIKEEDIMGLWEMELYGYHIRYDFRKDEGKNVFESHFFLTATSSVDMAVIANLEPEKRDCTWSYDRQKGIITIACPNNIGILSYDMVDVTGNTLSLSNQKNPSKDSSKVFIRVSETSNEENYPSNCTWVKGKDGLLHCTVRHSTNNL